MSDMNQIIRGKAVGTRIPPASESQEGRDESREEPPEEPYSGAGSADAGAGTANRQRREPGLEPRSMNERLREAAGR